MTNIAKQKSMMTVAALAGALITASLAGGCAHECPMPQSPPRHVYTEAAEAAAHSAATTQLDEAETSHTWNRDKDTAFDLQLSQLPPEKAYKLALRLANLVNTQKVKVDRGKPAPEAPPCTCSCNGTAHSTAAASKVAPPPAEPVGAVTPATPLTPASAVAPASATQKKP